MLRIQNLTISLQECGGTLEDAAARRLHIPREAVREAVLVRRAVDARRYRGAPIAFTHIVDVRIDGSEKRLLAQHRRDKGIAPAPPAAPSLWTRLAELRTDAAAGAHGGEKRPVIVGFGPAGMMAALVLARAGYAPLVLERGGDVDARTAAIETFWRGGALDETTNVQFGEGGAGTFSDGKLTTRIGDPRMADVIAAFIEAGAPEEIRWLQKPHIGTDLLRGVVRNLRTAMLAAGGEIRFRTAVTDVLRRADGSVEGVIVGGGDRIDADDVLLGIGHSARDTYRMLHARGFVMEAKAFAAGVRIEHPQSLIDRAQYGADAGNPHLPAADYALTFKDTVTGRGAYSFCMCPGGQVVAAASEAGGVVTNGMSRHARDTGTANTALLVQVTPQDFGGDVLGGIAFQQQYERLAFQKAGGDYRAPVQTVGDFLHGTHGSTAFLTPPTYRPGVVPVDLHDVLPPVLARTLADALPSFGRRIAGFDDPGAPMTGVEMRSSAPCRIVRDRSTLEAVGAPGLYPMGEGAGYAGGIMSAAVDGLHAALAFLRKMGHTVQ